MARVKKPLGGEGEALSSARLSMRASSKPQLVQKARSSIVGVKQNPDYVNEPKVQECTTNFEVAADALDKTNGALAALRSEEEALLSRQVLQVADLKRAARSMVAVINERTRGSAAGIRQWGFELARAAAPIVDLPPPPENLRITFNRAHKLVIRWDAVIGHVGYALQFGDATPDHWNQPIRVTGASYIPTELAIGQQAKVRVAVQRSSGMSPFSNSLSFTMR